MVILGRNEGDTLKLEVVEEIEYEFHVRGSVVPDRGPAERVVSPHEEFTSIVIQLGRTPRKYPLT